jgi:hypothetical protein
MGCRSPGASQDDVQHSLNNSAGRGFDIIEEDLYASDRAIVAQRKHHAQQVLVLQCPAV